MESTDDSMRVLLDQPLQAWPGNAHLMTTRLGYDLSLSGQVATFTVTIPLVYADMNRIVIGYVISAPTNRTFRSSGLGFTSPILTDTRGAELQFLDGAGGRPMGNNNGWYVAFSAGESTHRMDIWNLRLTFLDISAVELITSTTPASVPGETYAPGSGESDEAREVIVQGPLMFDIAVPVTPDVRISDLHRVVQVGATSVVVERIVVTPTEARVYLRGLGLESVAATLDIDGQRVVAAAAWSPTTDFMAYSFVHPLYDYRGAWTIIIEANPQGINGQRQYTAATAVRIPNIPLPT